MSELSPEAILEGLQPLFEEALDQPGLRVTRNSSAWNTSNWDSLAQIALIEMSERHFSVTFTLGELQEFKQVGDLVDLIIQKKSGT